MTKTEKAQAVIDLVRAILDDGRPENEIAAETIAALERMDTTPLDIIISLATFTSELVETMSLVSGMTATEYLNAITANIALLDAVGSEELDL